jgi:simple sugar transport system substrate-binding protein
MINDRNSPPPPQSRVSRRWLKAAGAAICVLALTALAACSSKAADAAKGIKAPTTSASDAGTSGTSQTGSGGGGAFPGGIPLSGKTILMVIYTAPLAAWNPALNAVKSVEAATGVKVDIEYANNSNQTEISEIQSGLSRKVAAMALQITSTGVANAVCAAAKTGIPVVAWNQNALTGASASCVQATMAQNFVTAGQALGQFMISNGPLKQGAKVFCPVEDTTATYAGLRAQGVNQALAAIGAKCDVVSVGDADAAAQTAMVQYLLGHRSTAAVIALGGIPLANAAAVLKRVSMTIPVGGFDVYDPRIPQGIKDGAILGVIDQQFYSQAFQAAQQLALELQYGLYPSDVATGGRGVVTKTSVGPLIALSGQYR